MCTELLKLVDKVSKIFPKIEAARPCCSLGIQALCSLNNALEKAKHHLQYCCDSSKLYLVCILYRFQIKKVDVIRISSTIMQTHTLPRIMFGLGSFVSGDWLSQYFVISLWALIFVYKGMNLFFLLKILLELSMLWKCYCRWAHH
jgi:hypothetical protein